MDALSIRPAADCRYDIVALGEVMLRLDPGAGRIRTARDFHVWEGGGEYNVARGLRRCFGQRAAVVTALARNEIGLLLEDLILQGGVETDLIRWVDYDGIGRNVRNGLNFTERGFGPRRAIGCSDRGHTAVAQLKPGDIDWVHLFRDLGVRWLHTGGIFAGLSETTGEVVLEATRAAHEYGTLVSYDLNYRPSLWKAFGGLEKCRAVNRELAHHVDVMIGNEGHFAACLGLEVDDTRDHADRMDADPMNADPFRRMTERARAEFPNFKVIATTLRTEHSATINDWGARCYADGRIHTATYRPGLEILDRVGGGDSFASGFIYGLMALGDASRAVEYGAAHGALAMTTPGDTTMASLTEVEELVAGGDAQAAR